MQVGFEYSGAQDSNVIERIVLLDFIHRLASEEQTMLKN
jgi:hypothetical protein